SKRTGVRKMVLPQSERGTKSILEKSFVNPGAFGRQHAHTNFGFRIPESDAKEALAMILHLHHRAVGDFRCDAEHSSFINPRMPCEDAICFARFQENGW